jgi:glycosyltransferase involved in cell wall biosynthesis
MPVLEAMACGTPVVALDNTAFPEFAGGVACLLPDAQVSALETGIADLLADKPRRDRWRPKARGVPADYDWQV